MEGASQDSAPLGREIALFGVRRAVDLALRFDMPSTMRNAFLGMNRSIYAHQRCDAAPPRTEAQRSSENVSVNNSSSRVLFQKT